MITIQDLIDDLRDTIAYYREAVDRHETASREYLAKARLGDEATDESLALSSAYESRQNAAVMLSDGLDEWIACCGFTI